MADHDDGPRCGAYAVGFGSKQRDVGSYIAVPREHGLSGRMDGEAHGKTDTGCSLLGEWHG